jgi:hypothetical protein
MAINRKGMRRLIVDDEPYYYKIKSEYDYEWCGAYQDFRLKLIIEYPDGDVKTHHFEDAGYHTSITPRDVKDIIQNGLRNV